MPIFNALCINAYWVIQVQLAFPLSKQQIVFMNTNRATLPPPNSAAYMACSSTKTHAWQAMGQAPNVGMRLHWSHGMRHCRLAHCWH